MSGPPVAVAVIIAARNPGPFLVEALASLSAQTQPPDEVVVVDDGSDDDTVVEAATTHPTARLIRQGQLGRAVARNVGVAATTAPLLLFLDADDRLRPTALATLGAALADPALDLVHGHTEEFPDADHPPGPGVRSTTQQVRVRLGGATLLRRSLWDRVGPLDPGLHRGEWIEWMDRAYARGARGRYLDDVVLERRLHNHNRTGVAGENHHYLRVARAALARKRPTPPEP